MPSAGTTRTRKFGQAPTRKSTSEHPARRKRQQVGRLKKKKRKRENTNPRLFFNLSRLVSLRSVGPDTRYRADSQTIFAHVRHALFVDGRKKKSLSYARSLVTKGQGRARALFPFFFRMRTTDTREEKEKKKETHLLALLGRGGGQSVGRTQRGGRAHEPGDGVGR